MKITSEWKWRVATEPSEEPLTASEVKTYLKVDVSTDDSLITAMIVAARRQVEAYTSTCLVSQSIVQVWDQFPVTAGALYLARGPNVEVTNVTYADSNGTAQTLPTTTYKVDDYDTPARLVLKYSQTWPDTYDELNAVTGFYTAGYSAASSVPDDIKGAMYMIIADMYENRTDYVKRLPTAAEYLLDKHRVKLF